MHALRNLRGRRRLQGTVDETAGGEKVQRGTNYHVRQILARGSLGQPKL